MGLEIQGAVHSMMASANQIHAQNEQNLKKAASIVLGGVTGGVPGMAKAAVQESSLSGIAKTALVGDKDRTGLIDMAAGTISPQAQAAQMADTSVQNEIEAKQAQRAKIDALPTSLGMSVGDLPEKVKNKVYEEYEKNGRNL